MIVSVTGMKKIPADLYADYADMEFGVQTVTKLQICEMRRNPDTGYYYILHEQPLMTGKFSSLASRGSSLSVPYLTLDGRLERGRFQAARNVPAPKSSHYSPNYYSLITRHRVLRLVPAHQNRALLPVTW